MRSDFTRSVAGWAFCAAEGLLSALLFDAALWFPPYGFLLCLVSPLPLAVASWRQGAAGAAVAVSSGIAAAALSAGPMGAAMYGAQFATGGCLLGLAVRNHRSPEVVVGAYAASATLGFWVLLAGAALRSGTTPLALLDDTVRHAAEQARDLLLRSEASPGSAAEIEQWAAQTTRVFVRFFPGIVSALTVLVGWANGLGLRGVLERRGVPSPVWNTWRIGEYWIWALIGSGLLTLLGSGTPGAVAGNVFVLVLAVYFLQGLAIIQHLFETRRLPRPVRAVAYALLFVQLPVMLLVAGLGAFDLWVDFRARWSPPPTKSAET